MSFSHTLTRKWSSNGVVLTQDVVTTSDAEDNRDISVASDATDALVAFVADYDQIKALYIVSDQDVLLETNSGSAPGDSIALKANKPLIWQSSDGYFACPFTTNVTALYLTNQSDPATAATVSIRMLVDSTV